MTTTGRTLLVLRHSKSAYPDGVADPDRPLSPRGRRDAVTLGLWIRDQDLIPDLVLCSTATRTRETWDLVSDQLLWEDEDGDVVRYDPRVYRAGPADLLGIIRETPPELATVALVGHNPSVAELAASLTGNAGIGFPTSALAVIGLTRRWDRVGPGSGSLDGYWTPKGGSEFLRS